MKMVKGNYPKNKFFQDLLFIFIVGLTPLLWFKSGHIINGPDVSFPLNPLTFFLNRFFTWNPLNNTGIESAINISTIFFHGLQAFFYWLSRSLFLTQKITYCFWFTLVCFSIYYFGAVIQKDKPDRIARYVLVLIYAFNPLVFNIWEVAKAAEISSLVATPLLLAFFIQGLDGRWSFLKASLVAGFSSFLFSEIGASPSVLAIPLSICVAFFLFYIIIEILRKINLRRLLSLLGFFGLFFTIYILFNAYWILPYFFEIFKTLKSSNANSTLEAFNMVNWLKDISIHTSIFNASRFQGAWDWYYTWYDEPYVFYARSYFKYPFLLMASVILPILAYMAIVFKRSRELLFFILLALLATFFAKGAHSPFENIFLWCSKNIPGFAAFRSPYYKFSLATIFAYAYLISITLSKIYYRSNASRYFKMKIRLRNLKEIKVLPALILLTLLFIHLAYSYPMLTGKIIPIRKKLFSLHLRVPEYVFESADWLKVQEQDFRVFALPREYMDTYRWGYGAPTSLLNLISDRPVVWGRSVTFCGENKIRDLFYEDLYSQLSPNLHKILQLLSVKYIWLRHDSWCDLYGDEVSPQDLKEKIKKLKNVSFNKSIGKWEFYELESPAELINAAKESYLIMGDISALSALANSYKFKESVFIFDNQNEEEKINTLLKKKAIKKAIFYDYPLTSTKEKLENDFKIRDLKFSFIYSTDKLVFKPKKDYLLPENIKLKKIIGLSEPEKLGDGEEWSWLWTNKEPNIFIHNSGNKGELINLIFDVFSFARDRDLYVYLNDKLFKIFSLKTDEPTTIKLKNLKLSPGENIISFYTPHEHDKRNRRFVSFAFSNFYMGALTFEGKFFIPIEGDYTIDVFPYSLYTLEENNINFQKDKEFIIDDKEFTLKGFKKNHLREQEIFLERGIHSFKLGQSSTEDYYIEISRTEQEADFKKEEVYFKRYNPTKYQVTVERTYPQFLIFNESYNPYWRLYIDNRPMGNHFLVNGYANGWYLDEGETEKLFIEYWPQRLFYLGSAISIASFCLAIGVMVWQKRWKK